MGVWSFGTKDEMKQLNAKLEVESYYVFCDFTIQPNRSNNPGNWCAQIPPRTTHFEPVERKRVYLDKNEEHGEQLEIFAERFQQLSKGKAKRRMKEHTFKDKRQFTLDKSQRRMDEFLPMNSSPPSSLSSN